QRILDWHVPAIELHHLRAHLAMDGVQSSFADGGCRLNRRQSKPRSASSRWSAGIGMTVYRNTWFFRWSNRRINHRGHRDSQRESKDSLPGFDFLCGTLRPSVVKSCLRVNLTIARTAPSPATPPARAYLPPGT